MTYILVSVWSVFGWEAGKALAGLIRRRRRHSYTSPGGWSITADGISAERFARLVDAIEARK